VASLALFAAAVAVLAGCHPQPVTTAQLAWAYPQAPDQPLPQAPPGTYRAPGSAFSFPAAVLNSRTPDWFPNEHPPAPPAVAIGHEPGAEACSNCHNYNGAGFIGIPDLAGLPAAYIIEQAHEFAAGRRRSTQPNRPGTAVMTEIAQHVGEADLAAAAAYYSGLHRTKWYRVVETNVVPATVPDHYGWRDRAPKGGTEPINGRIIELPEDDHRMLWMSDPHSGVVVYAPTGAVARGQALVNAEAGGQKCAYCHGPDLNGTGVAPPLAGRSAAYLARELWDIKSGARSGPAVAQMQSPAHRLNAQQVTDVAAYLSSLDP
jgi:cytochrome c553